MLEQIIPSDPKSSEIDHRTIRLLIGGVALLLAPVTSILASQTVPLPITSVSESYHADGWARDVFIGGLFTIGTFLLAYNGKAKWEMVLSKIAAVAAMGVALFPCACGDHPEVIPFVHAIAATVMFSILVAFCFIFRSRAKSKGGPEAQRRAGIYAFCAVAIILSMLTIMLDGLLDGAISGRIQRLVFYGEMVALSAFGVAWLTASKVFPFLADKDERLFAKGAQAT